MFNPIRKIFFSHQTDEIVDSAAAEPEFIREDFIIANYEELTIRELLQILQDRTYDFALDNRMTSATTEFIYLTDLPITVQLIDNCDYVFTVNRYITSSVSDAIAIIEDAVAF